MWRLAALILIVAIAACILAWLLTGKNRYKRWAIRLGMIGFIGLFVLFGMLIIGRLNA